MKRARRDAARTGTGEPSPDPFGEQQRCRYALRFALLGATVRFESDSAAALRLVRHAYARLPPQRFAGPAPSLTVRLIVTPDAAVAGRAPPPLLPLGAPGVLAGVTRGSGLVSVAPGARSALIVVPRSLLGFPYHLRYELIEFAVYLLAGRCQGLVALHAACVGVGRAGALVLGASGTGKSTLALASLAAGLTFLAEDSVLVSPRTLTATGVANFLHVRPDSLRFLAAAALARRLRKAPVIRRRSGVRKLEIDLRNGGFRLASAPLPVRALVFMSAVPASAGSPVTPLTAADAAARLRRGQRYAAGQPGWDQFLAAARRVPAFELRRLPPPAQVRALEALLRRVRA
jgi:hypothetical protein